MRLEAGQPYEHEIDPITLRDVPVDRGAALAWLGEQLAADPLPDVDAERARLALAGAVARLVGELDVAEAQLTRALELCHTDAQRVLGRVRLAHVWHWQERYDEAESEMRRCLADADKAELSELHQSFIDQHLGKCLFDQGRSAEAADCFERALRAREQIEGPQSDLTESSRMALARARALA